MEKIKSNQVIAEYAEKCLDKDKLKTFLEFCDFLSKNKLGIRKTGRKINGSWAIIYKNKMIGGFYISNNSWGIRYFNLFPRNDWFNKCEKYLSVELKDFILNNINTTAGCCINKTCHSRDNIIVLGKLFSERVCACVPIYIDNPNKKALEHTKELAMIGKNIIAEIAANSTV